jgi:general secretion pathway protein B
LSYVLDALRKAEAERDRGVIPGLQSQPAVGLLTENQRRAEIPGWVWMMMGAGAVALAALIWMRWTQSFPFQQAVLASGTVGSPGSHKLPSAHDEVPEELGMSTPRPKPVEVTPAGRMPQSRKMQQSIAERTESELVKEIPQKDARSMERADPRAEPEKGPQAYSRESSNSLAGIRAGSSGSVLDENKSQAEHIFAMSELPAALRRELPPLSVGGSVYSDSPQSRFVMINGQIFHEHDSVAPGLLLEQIRLKQAVLRYKDHLFRIAY